MTDETKHEAAMRKFACEATDAGKLIEAGWLGFCAAAMDEDEPASEMARMRMAFFAGSQHLFTSIMSILEEEATEANLRRIDLIDRELHEFSEGLARMPEDRS